MPKKKSKSKDKKKIPVEEPTEYELITIEENHVHQIKHENLLQRVLNVTILLKDVELAVKEIEKQDHLVKEWQNYLACDKIPKPFDPEKIRNFFEKSLHQENEDVENTIDWTLAIDERSILSQDIDFENFTKTNLKKSRVDFGEQYDVRICDNIELSARMEKFLESANKDVSKHLFYDLKELKQIAQSKITHYIDNLTYRVLSSEVAYMEPIDVTTAEYSYQGKLFEIHIWSFQNVPLNLDPEETKSKAIELQQTKINLVVPFSVLSENMVIRSLHFHFDHLSSRTRSTVTPIKNQIEQNLKICLQKEWSDHLKIQAEVKAIMVKNRADFEEAMRLKVEEEELKSKEIKSNDKTKKAPSKKKEVPVNIKVFLKEPPEVTPNLMPLVWRDFLEHESQEHLIAIKKFHPKNIRLSKGEVNLRQYQILGGVYHINSLSKPKAATTPKLIMTWFKTDSSEQANTAEINLDTSQLDDISKFFEITFELSDSFCHWSEPMACFFEENISPSVGLDICETRKTMKIGSPVIINDFNLHEVFTKSRMYDFIENSLPRIISSFQFPEGFCNAKDVGKQNKLTLGRRKFKALENEETKREFEIKRHLLSFDIQNNPERLFPLFKNVLPVVILPIPPTETNENPRMYPYQYFSEFLSNLDSIKESYLTSTFKDKLGNSVKISGEEYDKNIRRPRITTKLIAYEKDEGRLPKLAAHFFKYKRDYVGSRQSLDQRSSIKTRRLSLKNIEENMEIKPQGSSNRKTYDKTKESPEILVNEEEELPKWSTTNVLKSVFNAKTKKITIWTDRLGTIGFAFNRYQHFPFKSWNLQPNEENSDELELKVESAFALFRIYISKEGYKVFVSDLSKTLKSRQVFLEIKEPISDLKLFQKKIQEKFLNIFPNFDAVWYVNGHFSEKHLSAELHTYDCMSLYASTVKFQSSNWNKLSDRRTMVLSLKGAMELKQDFCLIRVTPEEVTFIEINEAINDFGVIQLEYVPTWRNIEWYADLNQLIKTNFSDTNDSTLINREMAIFHLRNLLHSLRLFSFS